MNLTHAAHAVRNGCFWREFKLFTRPMDTWSSSLLLRSASLTSTTTGQVEISVPSLLGLGKHEREKTSLSAELAEVAPAVSLSAGPKTNWIVGTKSSIGVDSNTVIIDGLTASGEVRLVNSL